MQNPVLVRHAFPAIQTRPAGLKDVAALVALEEAAFAADRISRRGFRRFLTSPSAALIVADEAGQVVGYALAIFRKVTPIARLYSIATAPTALGRGVGTSLLAAAEAAAIARGSTFMRLEVHETNTPAIARYRKSGYRPFGRRRRYYTDGGDALRYDKRLMPVLSGLKNPPPYFHQTTEFTCGPACMLMALAWSNPLVLPSAALEFRLWREATTIFMTSGLGGCDPFGLAVTLSRHGLHPELHVSQPGPYFIDTVRSKDKQRVMRLAQEDFRREAAALGIPIHVAPLSESRLMEALDEGAAAIVLVSGYRMVRRNVPHWLFAFGHEGHHVLVHDPAARRDDEGRALAPETYALPWTAFTPMSRFGRDKLSAALLIRKGPHQ